MNVTVLTSPLPVFRGDAQYRILGELYTNPGLEVMIDQLATRADVSQPAASREVARLAHAGLVNVRKDGRRRLVSANESSPVYQPLHDLLTRLYGPVHAIRTALRPIADRIAQAFIYGSWAARHGGKPGPAPRDIDVMVIGDVTPIEVWEIAADLTGYLGLDVNAAVRTSDEWASDTTAFGREIRSSPTVDVTP